MNWVDVIIILLCLAAFFRGREMGLVQEVCSAVGFFGGLFLGALLQPHIVSLAHSQLSRSILALVTTLGLALLLLGVGEYLGMVLKHRIQKLKINRVDGALGSALSVLTVLAASWLFAAILTTLPTTGIQASIKGSTIISSVTRIMPPAPDIVASLGHIIDPNGFPRVFLQGEPAPRAAATLPDLGAFQKAVASDRASVVKIQGLGCGGVVEGSGFVVADGYVLTNAHVVAGVSRPYVVDSNGEHYAIPVWFNPDLDIAVLQVDDLAGSPLVINTNHISPNTAAAVLGYPGGGPFTANGAVVLDEFTAQGRNIYNSGLTERDVYELNAKVIPGNSGGPLIAQDGTVIGVIFAESTTYNNVGYALSTPQIVSEIKQAEAQDRQVGTGSCANL